MRLGPLRHRWFAAFTGAIGLGGLGDEVARLALPLLILDLTHSIGAAATLRLVQALPYVFFGGIAGVLIDRAEKRKLLIACDVLSIAITSAIPLSVMAGVFSLDLLYFIGFLLGTVEVAWGVTTDFSVVPALVEPDELTSANAAYFGVDRAARVMGPTIGGLAIAALGTANAMFIAAFAFVPTLVIFTLMPPIYEADRTSRRATTLRNHGMELIYAFGPRPPEVPARIRGRAHGSFRTIVLIANSISAPFLSAVVVAFSSSAAFAVAGLLAILGVAVTYFTPLRRYNLNEPPAEEAPSLAAN